MARGVVLRDVARVDLVVRLGRVTDGAVVFFLFLWIGMLAVGVSGGAAFMLALICGALIFLFVRVLGEDELARPRDRVPRRWRP